jgi:hypothetical protein
MWGDRATFVSREVAPELACRHLYLNRRSATIRATTAVLDKFNTFMATNTDGTVIQPSYEFTGSRRIRRVNLRIRWGLDSVGYTVATL